MKINNTLTAGVSVLALAAMAAFATGASAHQTFYPTKLGATRIDPNRPVRHVGPYEPAYVAPGKSGSGTWKDVKGSLPFTAGPWNPKQLSDGTVIVLDLCTTPGQWFKLTPDKKGNYQTGKWSKIAAMPTGYSPLFFASQLLTDGRVIVNGGEYNAPCSGGDWQNKGALYDPVKDSWTTVAPPSGWASIGDAQSVILPDGSYMLADCCGTQQAIATVSGTTVTWKTTGSGKADDDDEEGWTNLPDGNLFTVDTWKLNSTGDNYEIYNTSTGAWTSQGFTPDLLTITSTRELGPANLTPSLGSQGTIVQFTGNPGVGVNDIYDVASNTWKSGPIMKVGSTIYDCADAPAATLPDGKILVEASPGTFSTPSHFWEWSVSAKGVKMLQVSDPAQAPNTSSFEGNLLVLPTGQVLWDNSQDTPNEVALYTPKGKPKAAWLPVVSSVSANLKVGSTGNAFSGKNFNGFDLGGTYGDDAQQFTNWPLVRVTNTSTGDVCFGRSYNFSTMGVWTSGTTNAVFDLPKSCETGPSSLQVIVNGIASTAVSVTLS